MGGRRSCLMSATPGGLLHRCRRLVECTGLTQTNSLHSFSLARTRKQERPCAGTDDRILVESRCHTKHPYPSKDHFRARMEPTPIPNAVEAAGPKAPKHRVTLTKAHDLAIMEECVSARIPQDEHGKTAEKWLAATAAVNKRLNETMSHTTLANRYKVLLAQGKACFAHDMDEAEEDFLLGLITLCNTQRQKFTEAKEAKVGPDVSRLEPSLILPIRPLVAGRCCRSCSKKHGSYGVLASPHGGKT
eukprot:m.529499 g.529499  ORF g.529499 m.529499 type:complete len:246 (+) comp57563_c0_seq69:2041-2778(+)